MTSGAGFAARAGRYRSSRCCGETFEYGRSCRVCAAVPLGAVAAGAVVATAWVDSAVDEPATTQPPSATAAVVAAVVARRSTDRGRAGPRADEWLMPADYQRGSDALLVNRPGRPARVSTGS